MAKVQISIDDELLSKLDDFANRNFFTRSGAISMAVSSMIMSDDIKRAIVSMSVSMRRIADAGSIDEKAKEDLIAFENLAKLLSENSFK